jgi:hypothetical protein
MGRLSSLLEDCLCTYCDSHIAEGLIAVSESVLCSYFTIGEMLCCFCCVYPSRQAMGSSCSFISASEEEADQNFDAHEAPSAADPSPQLVLYHRRLSRSPATASHLAMLSGWGCAALAEPVAPATVMPETLGAQSVRSCPFSARTDSLTFTFDPLLNGNEGLVAFAGSNLASSVDFAQTLRTAHTTLTAASFSSAGAGPLTPMDNRASNPFGLPVVHRRLRRGQKSPPLSSQRSRGNADRIAASASKSFERRSSAINCGVAAAPDPTEWSTSSSLRSNVDHSIKSALGQCFGRLHHE